MSQRQAHQPRIVPDIPTHVVSAETRHIGEIVHAGRVEVWGSVRGRVRAPEVFVMRHGSVDGHVEADHVRCDGHLVGSVKARVLALSRNSVVGGDIQTEFIGVEYGCVQQPGTHFQTLSPEMAPRITAETIAAELENPRSRPRLHPVPSNRSPPHFARDIQPRSPGAETDLETLTAPVAEPAPKPVRAPRFEDAPDAPRPFLVRG